MMRLLDTTTLEYEDDINPETTPYAILSHTWISQEDWERLGKEPTYKTFPQVRSMENPQSNQAETSLDLSHGVSKIRESCRIARASDIPYMVSGHPSSLPVK